MKTCFAKLREESDLKQETLVLNIIPKRSTIQVGLAMSML
jgi:hypothetical protein